MLCPGNPGAASAPPGHSSVLGTTTTKPQSHLWPTFQTPNQHNSGEPSNLGQRVQFLKLCVCAHTHVCVYPCVHRHMLSHSVTRTLCDPMDCSLLGSSVHGILQARVLEWVAIPSSRGLPDPGIQPVSLMSPALAMQVLYH